MAKKYEKFTYEYFVRRAKEIHGNKYNYDKVIIKSHNDKVKIYCNKHQKYFFQRPYGHLDGKGCPICANENRNNGRKYTTEIYIKKANEKHNNYYDYTKTKYVNSKSKIIIICKYHGEFSQVAAEHLQGKGCPKCAIKRIHNTKKLPFEQFVERANKIHNNKYIYDKISYDCYSKPVKIYCPKCNNWFIQKPSKHLKGQGCPKCKNMSYGEMKIEKWLKSNKIKYETQKRFKNCNYIQQLRFDFYLPDYNLCIEYQGRQHYEEVEIFDNGESVELRQKRDEIKKQFCKNNNIKLLEIKYTENIINKLEETISKIILDKQ